MLDISPCYFAPRDALPCDLPTRAEIECSDEIMCEQTGRRVVGVNAYFVVKYGLPADLHEGLVMLHIARNTSVSVPKVFALYQDPEDGKNFIIIERMQGSTLEDVWSSLSRVQKEAILGDCGLVPELLGIRSSLVRVRSF